jgi:serine/threonine protein kinase
MTAVEANEGKRPTEPLDPTKDNSRRRAGDDARRAYEENFAETMIADRSSQLPRFDLNEMSLGEVLGKGNFGTVLEIRKFECDEMKSSANSRHTEHRTFLQDNCIREDTQDARYAVKFVSHEVADNPESFRCAAYDLAVETRFLSVILHPNIVKLRAVASVSPFDERYFLIMDRLYDTLEKRLVEWKKSDIQHKRLLKDLDGSKQRALHQIRIIYAFDLSAALLYLHGHDILYRDLKPVNIGFDIVSGTDETARDSRSSLKSNMPLSFSARRRQNL